MDKLKISQVDDFVKNLLEDKLPTRIYFHTYGQAINMKKEADALAKASGLDKAQREKLALAALFYNTGYTVDYDNFQAESQMIATDFLAKNGFGEEEIDEVLSIMKIPFSQEAPDSILRKIMHDAYFSFFGQKKYRQRSEKLRKEKRENIKGWSTSDLKWEEGNFLALKEHDYFTQAAIERYSERLKINMAKSQKRSTKIKKKETKKIDDFSITDNKGAMTLFKTALRNHIDLTAIADQKSNMMLSINALILTIGMPVFASYLSDKTYLLIPSIIFMVTCISSMVLATLSTRPIKMDGETNLKKIHSGRTNLFFFGNFYNIGLDPYTEAIKKVVANKEFLDNSFINDLYYLGHSLGDKFKYLRMCYNVFISGIVISLISFIISYLLVG